MAKSIDAFNLNKDSIKGGTYLLNGDDGYILKIVEKFFRQLLPENSLSLYIIDNFYGINEISSCLSVYNFDETPNVVIVRDSDAKLDEKAHRELESLLNSVIEPNYLVFCNVNFLNANEKKLLTVINCAKPDRYTCISHIEKIFPYGIEHSASMRLADYTENNLARINNERIKLLAFCGDRKVTINDVESLVSEDRELQIFSIANNIASGNINKAMQLLEKMLSFGVSASMILSTVTAQFQRMLFCSLSPLSDEELATVLKTKIFAVQKAREIKNFNKKQLKDILDMLLDCEYRFKSGEISDKTALDIVVSKLLCKE